jgi:hypothetical protein
MFLCAVRAQPFVIEDATEQKGGSMRSLRSRLGLLGVILAAGALLPTFAQNGGATSTAGKRTVRVGVAMTTNRSRRMVSTNWERDQLVRELQRLGKNRKSPVVIEAVALDASSREEAGVEAAKNDCRYFVMTTMLDANYGPGVVASPQGVQRAPVIVGNTNPEQSVVVDFDLYEVGGFGSVIAGQATSPEDDNNDTRAADDAMRMVAMRVADKLKK